jgi:hypothetical protein
MSTKKTIQINPELFKMSGQKTRKNREKKELTLTPIISPNNLKNKLLKRIKEHKNKELKPSFDKQTNQNTETENKTQYSDEFYGAINYLSELTKKQKQQTSLNNKTLKNNLFNNNNSFAIETPNMGNHLHSGNINGNNLHSNAVNAHNIINTDQYVSLELPLELQETMTTFRPQTTDIFNVNYKTDSDVPYGCLKNGKKKTYKEWREISKTQMFPELQNIPDIPIRPPTPPKKTSNNNIFLEGMTPIIPQEPDISLTNSLSREERLEKIKDKLRRIQEQENASRTPELNKLTKMENELFPSTKMELDSLPNFDDEYNKTTKDASVLIHERQDKIAKENPKQYIKKTVRRKFTLGKIDKMRKVGILIKNKQTRKNVINTQRELKKMDITDIRKYLRQHGIMKVGSTCPPDILRKTFESALMAGEITNINKETMLHNFLNGDN